MLQPSDEDLDVPSVVKKSHIPIFREIHYTNLPKFRFQLDNLDIHCMVIIDSPASAEEEKVVPIRPGTPKPTSPTLSPLVLTPRI